MQFKSTLCFKCWFTNLWSTAVTFLSFFAYAVSTVTVDSLKLEQSRHVTNLNSYRYWRVFMGRYHWRLTVFYVITPTLCRRLEFYIRCCSYRIANLHRGSKVQVQEQEIIKCLIFRIETVTVIWRHFVAPLAFPSSLVCDAHKPLRAFVVGWYKQYQQSWIYPRRTGVGIFASRVIRIAFLGDTEPRKIIFSWSFHNGRKKLVTVCVILMRASLFDLYV